MTIFVLGAAFAAAGAATWLLVCARRSSACAAAVLRENEIRYRSLFEDAPVPYHEIDAQGVVRRVNQAECQLLGMEAAEMLGRPVWEFVVPETQEVSRRAVERKLAGEQPLAVFERVYVDKNGARIVAEIHESLIVDAAGKTLGIRSAMLDVTAKRQAERACAEATRMLEAVVRASPLALAAVDPAGRLRTWNPAAEELFGWKREEMLDQPAPGVLRECLERALAGEPVEGVEARPVRKDGSEVEACVWTAPLRDAAERSQGAVMLLADLTERKRGERRIRETEQRYRELFENANDIIFSLDLNGAITSWNKAGEQDTGYSRAEALGMNLADLLASHDTGRIHEITAVKLAGGAGVEELAVITRDGRRLFWEVNVRLQFQDGRPAGLEGIARDVTERKRAAEELTEKNLELSAALEAAREAAAAKSRFLANMSHEIRTPMNGIVGMSQLLLATPLSVEQRECAATIRSSADSLLAVIDDVLDISQMENGNLPLKPAPFALTALLDQKLELLEARAREKGLAFAVEIDPAIPRRLTGDVIRLRQVLDNLIRNAVKFTERGGVMVRLTLDRDGAESVLLRADVRDTGIGIARGDASRVFESFVQADDSATRRYGGAGLGLAICHKLVEMMGGRMGFESEPGQGSAFWFTVELGKADAAVEVPEETAIPEGAPRPGLRVLVAEDNEVNRKIALRMLARSGVHTDVVANGREAVEAIARNRYDLVLMDVHMPEMDGFAATAEIRRRQNGGPHIPIVAMTARAMAGDREECLAAGMDDYITKPIRLEDLEGALSRWTRQSAA